MKKTKKRMAYLEGNVLYIDEHHPDWERYIIFPGMFLAFLYEVAENPIVKDIIADEIRKISPKDRVGLDDNEIKDFAMDLLSRKIAFNQIEFLKCFNRYTLKEKMKNIGYTSGMSSEYKSIQKRIAPIMADFESRLGGWTTRYKK